MNILHFLQQISPRDLVVQEYSRACINIVQASDDNLKCNYPRINSVYLACLRGERGTRKEGCKRRSLLYLSKFSCRCKTRQFFKGSWWSDLCRRNRLSRQEAPRRSFLYLEVGQCYLFSMRNNGRLMYDWLKAL